MVPERPRASTCPRTLNQLLALVSCPRDGNSEPGDLFPKAMEPTREPVARGALTVFSILCLSIAASARALQEVSPAAKQLPVAEPPAAPGRCQGSRTGC